MNPGKKRGRPPKKPADAPVADAPEPPKRKNPRSSPARNTSLKPQAPPALVGKPQRKHTQVFDLTSDGKDGTLEKTQFKVSDLTSDSEEPKILAPLSPNSAMRQARVRHFEPKTPKAVDSASNKLTVKYSPVQGGPEEELDFTEFFSD
jgi:hypothetical protein